MREVTDSEWFLRISLHCVLLSPVIRCVGPVQWLQQALRGQRIYLPVFFFSVKLLILPFLRSILDEVSHKAEAPGPETVEYSTESWTRYSLALASSDTLQFCGN